jgi:RimJ/RimL family protein N-acetyltransferase
MPSFPDLAAPLCGPTAQLRLIAERDIPEILIAHQDDPELHARLGYERPPSGAELGRRTEAEAAGRRAGRGVRLTIVEPGQDECRGQLDAHQVDWEHQRAKVGIWVAVGVRGRGLATGALRLGGRWLCGGCGLERLELLTEPANEPMIRAARAAGFVQEGVLRAYARERRGRVDLAVLSLLRADLEAA